MPESLSFDELNAELDNSPESLSATLQRPVVTLPSGENATVRSIGVGDDNGEWVIPTIVNGKALSNDEAINLWKQGINKPLAGPFDSVDKANQFAQRFHEAEAKRIAPQSFSFDQLNEEIKRPQSFSFDDLNKELVPQAPVFEGKSPIATEQDLETAQAPWYKPPPEWTTPFGETTEIPSGANTSIPAVTIPLSSAGKAAAGVVDYFTTPQGITEGLALQTPAAPVIMLKWAKDMAQGGMQSAKEIANNVAGLISSALNRKFIDVNHLGVSKDASDEDIREHIQDISDNVVQTALMGVGALGAGKGAIAEARYLPKRFEAFPKLPPEPKFQVEDRGQTMADMAKKLEEQQAQPEASTPEVPKEIAQDPDIALALQSAQDILKRTEETKTVEEPRVPVEEAATETETKPSGLIYGTALDDWANEILKGGRTSIISPEILAAYLVRGASAIEKVGTDFAKWSLEFAKDIGEDAFKSARPHIQDIFEKSQNIYQARLERRNSGRSQSAPNLSARPIPVQAAQPGPTAKAFGSQLTTPIQTATGAPQVVEKSPYDPRARLADVGTHSARIEKLFGQTIQAGTEGKTIVNDFLRRAFGKNKDSQERLAKDFVALGWDNRRLELQGRGIQATQVPALTAAERVRILNQPEIQEAIRIWNRDIRPGIEEIRRRNQMLMSPNWGPNELMLNLPQEYNPTFQGKTGVNTADVYNQPARGETILQHDPIEALNQVVRGHLRYDASQQLAAAIRQHASVPLMDAQGNPNVVDPKGKSNPTLYQKPLNGGDYEAKFNGKKIKVRAIDLTPDNPTPDLHYVPVPVERAWDKQFQERHQFGNLVTKARGYFLSWGILPASFLPHVVREIAAVAGRIGQSGQTWWSVLPSWMGSNWKTLHRMMVDMRDTPYGHVMQRLVDRTGADRGAGFAPDKGSGPAHEALFNANFGIDVMARRTLADAALIKKFGVQELTRFEREVNAGRITPPQAMQFLESRLGDRGMVSVGREVNRTMGFGNPQTRSASLNWFQHLLPFISSESGKIPDEIRRFTTANLAPTELASSFKRGHYMQLAKQVAGSIANGPVGLFLLASGINYLTTKAQTGKGVPITDNPEGRRTDIFLGKDWYWSNLDPGLSRASRILGAKEAINTHRPPNVGRELINEALSVMAPDIRWLFTVLSDKSAFFDNNMNVMPARPSDYFPFAPARNVINAIGDEKPKGPAIAKDAAALLGVQLSEKPTPPEVLEAVRINGIAEKLYTKMRKMPLDKREDYFEKEIDRLKMGDEYNKIKNKLKRRGIFKYDRDE